MDDNDKAISMHKLDPWYIVRFVDHFEGHSFYYDFYWQCHFKRHLIIFKYLFMYISSITIDYHDEYRFIADTC